jgi:hypothetical protein
MTRSTPAEQDCARLLMALGDHRAALDRLVGELESRLLQSDNLGPIHEAEVTAGVLRLLQSASRSAELVTSRPSPPEPA